MRIWLWTVALFACLFVGARRAPQRVVIELLELNTLHRETIGIRFTQALAWDWSPDYCRWHCQGWWIVHWWFRQGDVIYLRDENREVVVKFQYLRETHTEIDPEVVDRKIFPIQNRRSSPFGFSSP